MCVTVSISRAKASMSPLEKHIRIRPSIRPALFNAQSNACRFAGKAIRLCGVRQLGFVGKTLHPRGSTVQCVTCRTPAFGACSKAIGNNVYHTVYHGCGLNSHNGSGYRRQSCQSFVQRGGIGFFKEDKKFSNYRGNRQYAMVTNSAPPNAM